MGSLWDDHHDGIRRLIDVNPTKITWNRYPLKDNGYGTMIDDTDAEPEDIERLSAWARISHRRGGVQEAAAEATGPTTSLTMYVIAPHDADLRQGDVIEADSGAIRRWRVEVVDELHVEGECYAKQAPLVRADG